MKGMLVDTQYTWTGLIASLLGLQISELFIDTSNGRVSQRFTPGQGRSTRFYKTTKGFGIEGITMHSYRYAFAERAKKAGYPQRFAQSALGHASLAVHEAYSRGGEVSFHHLMEYEDKVVDLKKQQIGWWCWGRSMSAFGCGYSL